MTDGGPIWRFHITRRPQVRRPGDIAAIMPRSLLTKRDERVLTVSLITNRELFGKLYAGLRPSYFWSMPFESGVYICPFVLSSEIQPGIALPGDIDLIVIPYEHDCLILNQIIAVEIKKLRISFTKQGKSPNEIGISQGRALIEAGFPYAAVTHLIVSDDQSPQEAWRLMGVARVIDHDGRLEMLPEQLVDWLPIDIMKRSVGRMLKAAEGFPELGLAAVFLGSDDSDISNLGRSRPIWWPETKHASWNSSNSRRLMLNVAKFFERHVDRFFEIPRFDPIEQNRSGTF